MVFTHNQLISCLCWQKCQVQYCYHILKMSVNGASTISGLASWTFKALCIAVEPQSMHQPPLWAKILLTIPLPPPKIDRQRRVNIFWSCILDNLRAMEQRYPIINLSAAFTGKNAIDDITSGSYTWAPTYHQQLLWGLSKLHSNELHCIVTALSLTRSAFWICPCIQLQKYACIVP